MLLLELHGTLKFSRSRRQVASWKTDKIPFWNMKRQPAESGKHFSMDDSNELSLNFPESFQRMKNCSYCGKEYADAVTVCPIDGQTVINQEIKPGKLALQPKATKTTFNVKLISPISSAGKYRVFVERSDLLFIQVEGGSRSILAAVAPFLGPAGNIIPLTLWLFTKRKTKAKTTSS